MPLVTIKNILEEYPRGELKRVKPGLYRRLYNDGLLKKVPAKNEEEIRV